MDDKRKNILVKNTILYALSSFGTKVFTFIIVPLYTYYLTTDEFGTYDTINSIIGLVTPMCILSIHEGILRWLLKSKENDENVYSTGLCIYFISILVTCILLVTASFFISWSYIYIFIICLVTATLNEILQFSARGLKLNKEFAISGIIQTLLLLLFNIILIIIFHFGVNGMLYSLSISQFISSVYLYWHIRKKIKFKLKMFDSKLAKLMLIYSILLVPNNISWWIMNSSDKIMLSAIVGSAFTGIYAISTKFPSMMNMINTIFYRAWQEQAVIEYDSKTRDRYYSDIFNSYMKICFSIGIMLIPVSKLYIQIFMNSSYTSAYKYIGILIIGSIFCSFSSFYGTGYISAKDTKNATLTTAIGAFINCIINFLFIKNFGIWAACFSTLLGYLITWVVRIFQTKKYFNINVNWKIFYVMLLLITIYSFLSMIESYIFSILMIVLSIVIFFIFNINEINGFIRKLLKKFRGVKR